MCPYKAVDSHGSLDTIARAEMKINISVCVYLGVLFEVYVSYNECNYVRSILRTYHAIIKEIYLLLCAHLGVAYL